MKTLLWIIPTLALAACQTEKQQEVEAEPTPPEAETPGETVEEEKTGTSFDVNDPDTLVGQAFSEVEAALKAAEISYRVVERDGESFPVTMDFQPDRLNFTIKDGVITAVRKG